MLIKCFDVPKSRQKRSIKTKPGRHKIYLSGGRRRQNRAGSARDSEAANEGVGAMVALLEAYGRKDMIVASKNELCSWWTVITATPH
jgi:hypothetical protein